MFKLLIISSILIIFSACSDEKKVPSSATSGMKCGAGKCGANMFDGKGALAKKKKNILRQMREDDPRKECVINANRTKEVYDCVRSPKTKRMTLKCGNGKCGSDTKKSEPVMKCGAGKCGSDM